MIGGLQRAKVGVVEVTLVVPYEPDDSGRHADTRQQVSAALGVAYEQV